MNREIKFRGLSENIDGTKEWAYGYLTKCDGEFTIDDEDGFGCFIDAETIGQYTDFKDSNGVEIYEGDIVKYSQTTGIVKFEQAQFKIDWVIGAVGMRGDLPYWTNLKEEGIESLKVLGNIYENKELLEGEDE